MLSRACLLAACLAHSTAVLADPPPPRAAVELARNKLAALDYEDALHVLDAAWRRGGSDPALAGAIAELAARAAASLDDSAAARDWYRRWLCIDPRAALPAGASPTLHAAFGAARGELGAHWLRAEARRSGDAVAIVVVDDPCNQAAAARDGDHRAAIHDGRASLRGSAASAIELVDGYGNALASLPVVLTVEVSPRAWVRRPLTWGIAGGATAALGAASLYIAIDARDQLRSLSATSAASPAFYDASAASLQQRFDRANSAGTLLVGAAIIATGVAVILWLRDRDGAVHPRSEIVTTGRAGAGVIGWSRPL